MYRTSLMCGAGLFCVVLTGCATKPVPSDVTGLTSYAIVQQIRCEARDAIRAFATSSLAEYQPILSEHLKRNPADFVGMDFRKLDEATRRVFERYDQGAIGYDFTFDITEKNKVGGGIGLGRGFSTGPLTIGFRADNNLERQNTRTFRSADTFLFLATQMPERFCSEVRKGTNWQYPISGSIGLRETLATFISLNQSANLVGPDTAPDIPTLVDTIEFTTTVSGSVSPKVELEPISQALRIKGADITLSGERIDKHKVVVGLTLPFDPNDQRARGNLIAVQRSLSAIADAKRESREERKASAIDRLIE